MLTVGVEFGHISVAGLTQAIAVFNRQHKPRKGKIAENPHRRWLGPLAAHTKMLVVEVCHLWRESPVDNSSHVTSLSNQV